MTLEYALQYKGRAGLEFPSLVQTGKKDALIESLDIGTDYDAICFKRTLRDIPFKLESLRIYRLEHQYSDFEMHTYVRLMDVPSTDVDKLAVWLMVCRGDRMSNAEGDKKYSLQSLVDRNDKTYQQIRLELDCLQLTEKLLVRSGKLQFPDFYISIPDFKKVPKREDTKTVECV